MGRVEEEEEEVEKFKVNQRQRGKVHNGSERGNKSHCKVEGSGQQACVVPLQCRLEA